ncbi:Gfo/Idh/MocA family protein [Maribacter halichondriae]|uniref:Gfo/Idh/MocA family protein n=1 Tax=Maribacter halichondriae TaxID=2980554 RepID=UPI0023593236|nr:Gfo/Idh/MocA family oxidoreductase [Maribacter sp. Hal144]
MKNNSRRSFIRNLGLGVGSAALLPSFTSLEQADSENRKLYQGKKLNIALCGLGRYANILAQSFVDSEYCHLSGIITGTPAKAVDWKGRYSIPDENVYNYENFDSIKDNPNIDLVYVVLPNGMHKDYTIRAAKAGKHVIVEKPMAFTEKDCQEMINACNAARVQLAVGYRLHYEPNHMEIMRFGQEKVFGQVRLIEVSLGYNISGIGPNDWHLKKALSGGGPLMNLGVYCVQASRYTLGEEPISVTAQFGPITRPNIYKEVEESITWQLNFPSGAVATSTSSNNSSVDRFFASAERGFFELSPAVSYGPFKGRSSEGAFDFPVINQQAAQMDGIAKEILEGRNLPEHISGVEGRKDMKVIEAIYKAAESGNEVILS